MNKATSLYLDLVRFLAASTVFLSHATYEHFTGGIPYLWRFGGFANDAVMVFFVLSGFVIAYVSDQKEKNLKEYSLSRLARLYSVAAPALLLTVILDYAGSRFNPSFYVDSWSPSDSPIWRFMANLLFVNELWFASVRPFSNGPFWSLGYEFWYYAIFAMIIYVRRPLKYFAAMAVAVIAGPKILLLFPMWLLGVWVYFCLSRKKIGPRMGWALFLIPVALYVIFRQAGIPAILLSLTVKWLGHTFVYDDLAWSSQFLSSYIVGLLVASHFLGLAAIAPTRFLWMPAQAESSIRYLAGMTFAIYLFHYPLLQFFGAITESLDNLWLRRAIVLIGTALVILGLGTWTERRKFGLKAWLSTAYEATERTAMNLARR